VVPVAATLIGRYGARRMASRRLVVERNLRRALGPEVADDRIAELVDHAFASYVQYWIESFRLPGTSTEDIDRGTVVVGYEHIAEARVAGKGAILALPHLGAWEWAAFWLNVVHGDPVTAVAEQIEPPELAEWFIGLRNRFGIEVVPFGPDAASACVRALKANRLLALPSDRDLSGTGVPVTFFGEETTLPGGPATLALRTGAPLIRSAATSTTTGTSASPCRPSTPSAGASCATTSPGSPRTSPTPWRAWSAGRPTSGTSSSPTGRRTTRP
jgi:lauroyl/myristoyl acyltransferase